MEPDLQIIIKKVPEEIGSKIGNALIAVINAISETDQCLDFRRMHRIIVTSDFAGELVELSQSTVSSNAITHTREEYAVAVAKVLLLPRQTDVEILPVLDANFMVKLTEDPGSEAFQWMLHLLHHELCHVHDDNKKLDALPNVFLNQRYIGKDIFIGPLSEVCWSEYIANRLSSGTAIVASIAMMTDTLIEALMRTKTQIDKEIMTYRFHANLDKLMSVFQRHGEFLPKTAAYVLGYMDGLNKSLQDLSPKAAESLSGSYFEPIWNEMQTAFRDMHVMYPNEWRGLQIYTRLALAMEEYYATMGLFLSTTEDGRTYVNVPF